MPARYATWLQRLARSILIFMEWLTLSMHAQVQKPRPVARKIFVDPFLVQLHRGKVLPDTLVLCAIVGSADFRPMFVDRTAAVFFDMGAIAAGVLPNVIWSAQVPFDLAGFDLLRRQRKVQSAADRLADMNPLRAVDGVFVSSSCPSTRSAIPALGASPLSIICLLTDSADASMSSFAISPFRISKSIKPYRNDCVSSTWAAIRLSEVCVNRLPRST
jgi:hypothetical protein